MRYRLRNALFSIWSRVIVAGAIVLITVIPASFWHTPRVDAVVSGFDSDTMYVNARGIGEVSGVVSMTSGQTRIAAVPGSSPSIDLATSPVSYASSFGVTILEADEGSSPLSIALTAPYTNYQFALTFTSAPDREVVIQRLHDGLTVQETNLGTYAIGQQYQVQTRLDRQLRVASITLSTPGREVRSNTLDIQATDVQYESHVLTKKLVPVVGGTTYTLQADTKALSGGSVGANVEWIGRGGKRLGIAANWRPTGTPGSWQGQELQAQAPAGATGARVELATAAGAEVLFANVRLENSRAPGINLLPVGTFADDASGWRRADGDEPLDVQQFSRRSFSAQVTAAQWPPFFASLRMALVVTSSSTSDLSVVSLSDFKLDMLHQRWLAVRVDDQRLRLVTVLLAALAALLLGADLVHGRRRISGWLQIARARATGQVSPSSLTSLFVLSIAVFGIGNALLGRIGSLNADIIGARVWGYTSALHGPAALYFSPNVASAEAQQWQGLPLQEAGFPYGPVMAYIMWAMGLVYRLVLWSPVLVDSNLSEMDLILKATIGAFTIADAVICYVICRQFGLGRRGSSVVFTLILFNPAVWFANSVWGTTQSISVLFLLLTVLAVLRRRSSISWALLIAACMTRPQSIFVAVIIAVYLLRTYRLRETLESVARALLVTFVYLLPFALLISPTLPVDILVNAFSLHVGYGNDLWTMPLSYGGMSIWPLAGEVFGHLHGVDSLLSPSTEGFIGGLTYYTAGSDALLLSVVALVAVTALRARRIEIRRTLPLALTLSALNAFMLNTSTPSYHFLLAVFLLALCARCLGRRLFFVCFSLLSTTTFAGMYSLGAYWLSSHATWSVGIYSPAYELTRAVAALPTHDWFVTACCLANVFVYIALWGSFLSSCFGRQMPDGEADRDDRPDVAVETTEDSPTYWHEDDVLIGGKHASVVPSR